MEHSWKQRLMMSPELWHGAADSFVWFGLYTAAALGLAAALFQIARAAGGDVWRGDRRAVHTLVALGALPLLDAGQRLGAPLGKSAELIVQAALVLAALAMIAVASSLSQRWHSSPQSARIILAALLLLLGTPTLWWSSLRLHELPACITEKLDNLPLPLSENLLEASEVELRTDRGARIPAYQFMGGGEPEAKLITQLESHVPAYSQVAIRRGAAELESNCHGWVFAGGEYLIGGASVDRILADNQYQRIADPQPGDLIVYRDTGEEVLHTGIVKAIGKDGFVLIESKWGLHGRYLHEPQQQSYSTSYAYYRSPRRGHRLHARLKSPHPQA